jgi:hypothetical protein
MIEECCFLYDVVSSGAEGDLRQVDLKNEGLLSLRLCVSSGAERDLR